MNTTLEQTYAACLDRLVHLDINTAARRTGVQIQGTALILPFFSENYRLESGAIVNSQGNRPADGIGIVR